jgi:cytochrome c oxidase cbb3-type subunit 3
MATKGEKDRITGTEMTGHEWDGIRELDTPLPRWWLWTFYATIVWAFGYMIVMPAVPLIDSHTAGVLGYSSRAVVAERMVEAAAAQQVYVDRIAQASLQQIADDPELSAFAEAGGRSAFAVNCSQCHGTGAAGAKGYPNLNDDDWLWGGTLEEIHGTLRVGIRSDHADTRNNVMAGFLKDGLIGGAEVEDVANYVLSLTGQAHDQAAAERGLVVFTEQCVACHQEGGVGSRELGAPSLADSVWLYGGSKAAILETISYGRGGVMPAWEGRLSPATLKLLAVYVHALGGGE